MSTSNKKYTFICWTRLKTAKVSATAHHQNFVSFLKNQAIFSHCESTDRLDSPPLVRFCSLFKPHPPPPPFQLPLVPPRQTYFLNAFF